MLKRVKYAFVAGMLSISMVLGLSSTLWTSTAYASTSSSPPPVKNGWVQVSTADQLKYIDQHQSSYLSSNIELMNNINLGSSNSSYNWTPFGNSTAAYSGTFNGNGYTISGWSVNTSAAVGGLFGKTTGTIENLGVQGNVTDDSPFAYAGGLVGVEEDNGTIQNSYATGTVSCGSLAGGLVGASNGTIQNSYATGSVNGYYAGGLVGWQAAGMIDNSYATGHVNGNQAGGLVGTQQGGSITNSYFDTSTTNQQYAIGGTTDTTGAESTTWMQTPTNFTKAGWSTSNWALYKGQYPLLSWQTPLTISMAATPTKVLPGKQVIVTGSVHSSGGSPLSGVSVTLSDNAGGSWSHTSVKTDSSGEFTDTWTAPTSAATAVLTASVNGTSVKKQGTIQVQAFTVTYNGNGNTSGTVPTNSNTYTSGSSATVLGNPGNLTKTGYKFAGWNTKSDGSGTSYLAGSTLTMPASNVTLYAKWLANKYTVTFNSNGGSSISSETVTYNGTATKPTDPTKTGYTFAGWYSDSRLTTPYSFSTPVTGNETLYAKWTANPYTVTYKGNGNTGGIAPTDSPHTIGSSISVLGGGTLIKTGYTFAGWNTKADGSGTTYAAGSTLTMGATNVPLYAKWTVKPSISTSTLPNVLEGTSYNQKLQGTGGVSPYTFSVASGSLPKGLTLQSDGSLGGTPQQGGTFHFAVQINDHAGTATTKDLSLYVIPTAPTGYLKTTSTTQVVGDGGGTLTSKSNHTTATLVISSGTFTNPLQMDITTGTVPQSLVPSRWNVVVAYGVNFDANNKPAHPLSFTLLNAGITPQSKVYKVVNGKLIPVSATVTKGKAVIAFTTDPDFVVLKPKPVPQATKPVTGFSAFPWAAGGLLTILTGGMILWWQRRKKHLE